MGISYGGPAYHDVISSEVVIAAYEDFMQPTYWYRKCLVHEIIHAQGFTSEMDTEILTWLALRLSSDPLDNSYAQLMVLIKSKIEFAWPKSIEEERVYIRKTQLKSGFAVNMAKKFTKKFNIKNRSDKYGSLKMGEHFAKSEFLVSVAKLDKILKEK